MKIPSTYEPGAFANTDEPHSDGESRSSTYYGRTLAEAFAHWRADIGTWDGETSGELLAAVRTAVDVRVGWTTDPCEEWAFTARYYWPEERELRTDEADKVDA